MHNQVHCRVCSLVHTFHDKQLGIRYNYLNPLRMYMYRKHSSFCGMSSVSFLVFGFVVELATESYGFQIWRL
jgi:hypothetical protein